MKRRITNLSGISPDLLKPGSRPETLPPWLSHGGRTSLFLRAKSALFYGFASLGLDRGDEILMPAFICKTVSEPLIRAGATVRFFPVNKDLSVDWSNLEQFVTPKTKALLHYHYLGLPYGIREAKLFCTKHGLRFIEDAAHALFSKVDGRLAGTLGDASILSLRKCIPMSFGAALSVNADDLPGCIPPEGKTALSVEAEGYWQERAKYLHQLGWQNSNTTLELDFPLYSYHANQLNRYFTDEALHAPLDSESLTVMHNVKPDKVQTGRCNNYNRYFEPLASLTPFPKAPTESSPMGFPILIKNRPLVQKELLNEGIETLVHWDRSLLPPETLDNFPDAYWLADNVLSLPTHEQLSFDDIDYVIYTINKIVKG